jgi:cytochrome c556
MLRALLTLTTNSSVHLRRLRVKNLKALLTGFALAALTACGGGTDPNSPEYQAFMQRDAVMEELGEAILPLNQMSQEEIPVDEQVFLESARTLAARAGDLLDGFDNQTLIPESRVTADIWANWDDFVAKNDAMIEAANALVAAAESGGFAAGRDLVRPLRDSCGNCHRPYRGPEPD